MQEFQITLINPANTPHIEGLRDIADGLAASLRTLGHMVSVATNSFDRSRTNILLGAHLLDAQLAVAIPQGSIVYNFEQLGGAKLSNLFLAAACMHQIWDYSPLNLKQWNSLPCQWEPRLLELGFVPELARVERAPEQDIDVLFYGSLNERRAQVLNALRDARARVHHVFGVYGQERDALIARARVVLNIHFYETQVFEAARVSYLLNNGKAVVTEASPDLGVFAGAVLACPFAELVSQTLALLANEDRRFELERKAAETFARRPHAQLLAQLLNTSPERRAVAPAAVPNGPRRMNLGSGKDWRPECLNIDINDYWRPDAVLDISQEQPPVIELHTQRFGTVRLGESSLDEIMANDVLEHIPNLTQAMACALRMLAPGGVFRIQVPYDLSWGAWQDPTHVRAFNERSWLYYTDWFWYLGWTEARFAVQSLEYVLSPLGEQLQTSLSGDELIRTPRAVDAMRVTLRKQLLSAEEAQFVAGYLKRPERNFSRVGSAAGAVVTAQAETPALA